MCHFCLNLTHKLHVAIFIPISQNELVKISQYQYEVQGDMIVLTTSGHGNKRPNMEGKNFDAISSALKQANVDAVANQIIDEIKALIGQVDN